MGIKLACVLTAPAKQMSGGGRRPCATREALEKFAPNAAFVSRATMPAGKEKFVECVVEILDRYFRQNEQAPPARLETIAAAERLWTLIQERGLPQPLAKSERGEPGEMPETESAALLNAVIGTGPGEFRERLANPMRQLVKACFYPEFKTCRDSFREVSPDGSCRRQELARARVRASGSHCVDCPHWVALTPAQHAKYLAREWRGGAEQFFAHQSVFLPEDFRALRLFLYHAARESSS